MSFMLISNQGVHYEGGSRGVIQGLFVPSADQVRAFADLSSASSKQISERYGKSGLTPIWRVERGQAVVYGTLPQEVIDRREEVNIYLPDQLIPKNIDVFYIVFGKEWLVHGVKSTNDDGLVEWGISKTALGPDTAVKHVVAAVAERMLIAREENYMVAVCQNEEVFKELKNELEAYDLDVTRYETLKPQRDAKPVYRHRNYSLIMMTIAILALLVVLATGYYWYSNQQDLQVRKRQIKQVQFDISQIELNKKIGHIRNPQEVLQVMSKALSREPSAILNAASQLGAHFGDLERVTFDMRNQGFEGGDEEVQYDEFGNRILPTGMEELEDGETEKLVRASVFLSRMANNFLIDQENLAKSLLVERPWLLDLKASSERANAEQTTLEIVMRVE